MGDKGPKNWREADTGISCIEPPQQQTLCATMPQGCGTVTMYNKVCFMHLLASLLPQSKLRLVEIGTNGPFVLEIFTERESAFTTENLRMQTRPSRHITGLKKVPIHSRLLKRGTLTVVAARPPRKL